MFRGVDELGQIARGEFPVGDIDPVTPEQRAAFQRLARRQIERRAVERELPGGLTVFDVADMDDDQLNTRIAGLVAADPVGDDLVISSQLRALQAERARRQGFNSNEENWKICYYFTIQFGGNKNSKWVNGKDMCGNSYRLLFYQKFDKNFQ